MSRLAHASWLCLGIALLGTGCASQHDVSLLIVDDVTNAKIEKVAVGRAESEMKLGPWGDPFRVAIYPLLDTQYSDQQGKADLRGLGTDEFLVIQHQGYDPYPIEVSKLLRSSQVEKTPDGDRVVIRMTRSKVTPNGSTPIR